jgi:hypothetical protein
MVVKRVVQLAVTTGNTWRGVGVESISRVVANRKQNDRAKMTRMQSGCNKRNFLYIAHDLTNKLIYISQIS